MGGPWGWGIPTAFRDGDNPKGWGGPWGWEIPKGFRDGVPRAGGSLGMWDTNRIQGWSPKGWGSRWDLRDGDPEDGDIPVERRDGDSRRVRVSFGNGVSRCPRTHPEEQVEEEEHVLGHRAHEGEIIPEGPGGDRHPPRHGRAGPSGAERDRTEPSGIGPRFAPQRAPPSSAPPSARPALSLAELSTFRLSIGPSPRHSNRRCRPLGCRAPVRALKGQAPHPHPMRRGARVQIPPRTFRTPHGGTVKLDNYGD